MREERPTDCRALTCRGLGERERPGERVSPMGPSTSEMGGGDGHACGR